MRWQKIRPKMYFKELSRDNRTGARSILLLLKKGMKIIETEAHIASEEGFFISGKLREGIKGSKNEIIFTKGCYFFRPSGILHGPWEALEDTISFLTLDRTLNNIRNPYVWDCPNCKDGMMWSLDTCTNCHTKRPRDSKRYKVFPDIKTFVSIRA